MTCVFPSRIAFADVRNHLTTPRLRELVGGDVFCYHTHVEIWLHARWVKVAPVFNGNLCRMFGVPPLDFDGQHDAVLQRCGADGGTQLQEVRARGSSEEFPYEDCIATLCAHHPRLFDGAARTRSGSMARERASTQTGDQSL